MIAELLEGSRLSSASLAEVGAFYPVAIRQRTGWLIESLLPGIDAEFDLTALEQSANGRAEPTPLAAAGRRAGPLDERWNVLVNIQVEPDL